MRSFLSPLAMSCIAFALCCRGAHADLIVTIEDTVLFAGAGGVVNVYVRSDNSTDTLSDFLVVMRVERQGTTASQLRFVDPQSDGQLNDPNYIFSTGSLKRDGGSIFDVPIPPSPFAMVSTSDSPNDTFTGSDSALPLFSGAVVVGTSNRLLAQLELQSAVGLLATQPDDRFRVIFDTEDVSFFGADGIPLSYTISSTSSGNVGIAAIPEPCGLGLVAFLGWLLFLPRVKR